MQTTSFDEVFQKIRINFLFNHPFLSVLALSIPTIYTQNENAPFQTDSFEIKIDIDKLVKYSNEEITYLYAHTLLHIVLKHPKRREFRDIYIWNKSCDLVINLILQKFKNVGNMPIDVLIDEELEGKCVEEVYEILYKEEEKEEESSQDDGKENSITTTEDENGDKKYNKFDPSKLDIEEVNEKEKGEKSEENLDSIIIQALSIAKSASQTYEGLRVEIDTLLKPNISIKDSLKEYLIESLFEKNLSYSRPNRKFIHQNSYLPGSVKSNENLDLYVALDSSSSVTTDEYREFLGVIKEICEDFYEYTISIIPFDLKVKEDFILEFDSFSALDEEEFLIPKSDGGTNFDEVLRYLQKKSNIKVDSLLIVLSDGEFEFEERVVSNTLFVISNKKNLKKFESYGRVIQFNI